MDSNEYQENSSKRKVGIRRFFSLRIILLIVGVILLGGLGGTYQYSTSPQFCRQCHIMEPYYQAWASSTHNFVPCVDCHYPPGIRDTMWVKYQAMSQLAKYVTRTYSSKPFAEIEDASCLRSNCHATQLMDYTVLYKGFVKFNHKEHLNKRRAGKELRCTSCHSQIVVGSHMSVTETTCFLCHFNKGVRNARTLQPLAGCDKCHSPPDKIIKIGDKTYEHKDFVAEKSVACQSCHINSIQGTGEALKERCFDCHNNPEQLERFKDTSWLHDQHVSGKNIECTRCHKPIQHKMEKVSLSAPHQVDCQGCHQAEHDIQQLFYLGTGGIGVPDTPSPMLLAHVNCIACHTKPTMVPGDTTLFQATEKACLNCHPDNYKGMVADWKKTIHKAIEEFRPRVEATRKALEKNGENPNRYRAQELFNDVLHNFKMLNEGNPVHNIYYAARLLQESSARVDKIGEILSFSPPPVGPNSLISGSFCATLCHAKVGVHVTEMVTWNDIRMPHRRHAETMKIGCANCHDFKSHKKFSIKISREKCLDCHHKALKQMPNIPCQACHRKQAAFRKGQSLGEKTTTKAPMTTLPCKSCHMKIAGGHKESDVRDSCKMCHKPFYVNILDSWKSQAAKRRTAADVRFKEIESRLKQISMMAGLNPDERIHLNRAVNEKLTQARKFLETVALDQSGGVHNIPYALSLITQAEKAIGEAENTFKGAKDGKSASISHISSGG